MVVANQVKWCDIIAYRIPTIQMFDNLLRFSTNFKPMLFLQKHAASNINNHPLPILTKFLSYVSPNIFKQPLNHTRLFFRTLILTHCMKSVQIRSFFWSVFSCIRTKKNSVFGHFLGSDKQSESARLTYKPVSLVLPNSLPSYVIHARNRFLCIHVPYDLSFDIKMDDEYAFAGVQIWTSAVGIGHCELHH